MCIGARWPDRATNQKVARSSRAGRINNQKKTKQIEEKKGVRSLTPFRLVPRRVPLALFLLFFLARESEFLQRLGEHSRDLLIHFDVAFIRAPLGVAGSLHRKRVRDAGELVIGRSLVAEVAELEVFDFRVGA